MVDSPAPYTASFEVDFIRAYGVALGTCRFSEGLVIGPDSSGNDILVLFERQARADVELSEIPATQYTAIVADPAEPETSHLLTQNGYFVLLIDRLELKRRLVDRSGSLLGGGFAFTSQCIVGESGAASVLLTIATMAYRGLKDGSLRHCSPSVESLCETLMQLMLETIPHRLSGAMQKGVNYPLPRSVKRAVDFMQKNLSEPITLDDLALATGASRRALQRDFRNFKSAPPMSYLKYLRLEAAHQKLSDTRNGETIADIAKKCGFTHMSRFAADYRIRYGALPSVRLRRAD